MTAIYPHAKPVFLFLLNSVTGVKRYVFLQERNGCRGKPAVVCCCFHTCNALPGFSWQHHFWGSQEPRAGLHCSLEMYRRTFCNLEIFPLCHSAWKRLEWHFFCNTPSDGDAFGTGGFPVLSGGKEVWDMSWFTHYRVESSDCSTLADCASAVSRRNT